MDLNIDPSDFAVAVLQELWKKLAIAAKELVKETDQVVFEKGTFMEFSNHIAQLSILFEALQNTRVETTTTSQPTRAALETLYSQLRTAHNIIREYKSGSQLRLVLNANSVLKKMEEQVKEIADTISWLDLANLDAALNLKSNISKIIDNLRSIEFRSAVATEAIASEIENTMLLQNEGSRDRNIELLHKIADAVGANVNVSLVEKELILLKQEKEEMEAQKKQAEALQLSQLMQLLYRTEMVPSPEENEPTTYQQNPIDSFTCPLCHELMRDPVAIDCGHSFERKAIQKHFSAGQKTCPTCKQELATLELTPNISLRGSVEEWLRRETDVNFQDAVSGIISNDPDILSKSLESLQSLLELPRYKALVSQKGLIPKMVEVLKASCSNKIAALKCLHHLSSYCDENKEAIIRAGAIRYIVKHIYEGAVEPDAVAILLELSTKGTLVEQIGNAKDCITLLVSLQHNSINDVSQKAKRVLQNLSSNTHFVIKMANVGYFQPFITHFNEGPSERRALMAAALVKMQLCEDSIKNFEQKQFIHKLVKMLSSSSPACKTACLNCIKELLIYPRMVNWFLAENTIPLLTGLISFVSSEDNCRKQATQVLTSLIKATQLSDFQTYPDLQELQSQHNISLFLQISATSDPQFKAKLLQLLLVLTKKSEIARNLIRSDMNAVANLFSFLNSDQPTVKKRAMKLIYCISKDHPAGVPLPACLEKESAINAIVTILTSSPDIKERSTAAGIISQLPTDDIIIDEILHRSEALKAIQEVICATDNEHCRVKVPIKTHEYSLLENALAALLRYTQPTKPELQRQVRELELYPSLVRVLSIGSSLAKQRTAIALADLCQSSSSSRIDATIRSQPTNYFPLPLLQRIFSIKSCMSWCCSASAQHNLCVAHGSACSSKHTFCLVKADAVRPLVQMLGDLQSGTAEAALIALNTLLADQSAISHTATAIVDSKGVAAILEVLEKGSLSTKDKALDLLKQLAQHIDITNSQCQRSERILIHLLTEDALKRKAALVLRQMNLLPEQSSYF